MQREAKTATVTYHAPQGDSKVVEAFGLTFYDGKPETVEVEGGLLAKMMGNKFFEVVEGPPPAGEAARSAKSSPEHDPKDHQKDQHKGR